MKRFTFGRVALLIAFVISTSLALAGNATVRYTTLSDGLWSDPDIWTIDGETPCNCYPPYTITDFIQIEHNIVVDSDLLVAEKGELTIEILGTLEVPYHALFIGGGKLHAYGYMNLSQLEIGVGSYALMAMNATIDIECNVLGKLDLYYACFDTMLLTNADLMVGTHGELMVSNASIRLENGDLLNYGSTVFDNASVNTSCGFMYNYGTLHFSQNGCLSTLDGDFVNGGEVSGQGAISAKHVENTFDAGWIGVSWCATESSTGVAVGRDCSTTDSICALTGQDMFDDVDGFDIGLRLNGQRLQIHWSVDGERGVMLYEIQRASSDMEFMPIGWIDPNGMGYYHKSYGFVDELPFQGRSYYRIAVWSIDGTTAFSRVKEVNLPDKRVVN